MQYILEQGVCHGTVFNSCHTSSTAEKNPLTEIQEGELYLCLEHRTVRVRERIINLTSKEFDIAKGRFSFRLTAPYSEERREAARRYAKENNATDRLK